MPGEHYVVGKCQWNAGEFLGNVRVCVQCASSMQGNTGDYQGNQCECKVAGESRGTPGEFKRVFEMFQGNAGECQRNVCKWVQSARSVPGNAWTM